MAPSSPTVARWELALRIKARREELGLTVQAIADHLGFSRNYWSAVENERSVLADDKFEALMKLMKFDDETIDELTSLHATSRERSWWADYPGLDDETRRFLGLESGASRLRNFESLTIPGLLQTPAYAAAVFDSDPLFPRVEIDQLVELRMQRQQRLFKNRSVSLTAVFSEASTLQHVADPDTQMEQLRHLVKIGEEDRDIVELRMVPFTAPLGPLITSSTLLLMDFESDHLATVGWQEAIRPIGVIEDEEQLKRAILGFEEVAASRSLEPDDTLTRLKTLVDR